MGIFITGLMGIIRLLGHLIKLEGLENRIIEQGQRCNLMVDGLCGYAERRIYKVKTHQAFRYELKPNNKQERLFIKSCGVARFAYNWGLSRRIELYRNHEGRDRYTTSVNQSRELNVIKRIEFPWMYEVSKCVPVAALRDLDRAYTNFYRRIKEGEKVGLPKFKKKGTHDSFQYGQTYGTLKVVNNTVHLPKVGYVNVKESMGKMKGRILSITVSREADRWFCSLCVEVDRPEPEPIQGDIVGIDLGLKSFAVVSNGKDHSMIDAPKPLKKRLKKIRRLHRQQCLTQKTSHNRKKANLSLARGYRKVRNIRKDFLSKLTSELTKTKSVIVIEDLAVKNMVRNKHLSRSIVDVSWGEFRRMLEYKTKWYGSRLIIIDRFEPTSKTCSCCGAVNNELTLSDRIWVCMECGDVHDRDENASDNIRNLGIAILDTESSSGIHACGQSIRPPEAILVEAGSKHTTRSGQTYGTVGL